VLARCQVLCPERDTVRDLVEREAFGISPWRSSIIRAPARCTCRASGQRRLCPWEKGVGDVAPFGERYKPMRHATWRGRGPRSILAFERHRPAALTPSGGPREFMGRDSNRTVTCGEASGESISPGSRSGRMPGMLRCKTLRGALGPRGQARRRLIETPRRGMSGWATISVDKRVGGGSRKRGPRSMPATPEREKTQGSLRRSSG
jgi:hypothetical protein